MSFFRLFPTLTCCITALICCYSYSQSVVYDNSIPTYHFKTIVAENGEIDGNTCITQDHNGYIWVGTLKGLYRFDGISSRLYSTSNPSNNLIDNNISTLFVDSSNKIWIGYQNSGFSIFGENQESLTHFSKSLPEHGLASNMVNVFSEDHNRNIWIGTDEGVSVFNRVSESIIEISSSILSGHQIISIMEADINQMLIGTNEGLYLINFNSQSMRLNKETKLISQLAVTSLARYEDMIWIGTRNKGIYKYNLKTANIEVITSSGYDWSATEIKDIEIDSNNQPWFATNQGIATITADSNKLFLYSENSSHDTGFLRNNIDDLLIDQQNNLWLIGIDSLQRANLQSAKFKTFKVDQHLTGALRENDITMLAFDNKQNLWVGGSTTGLYQKIQHVNFFIHHQSSTNSQFKIKHQHPWGLMQDNKNRYWIGTNGFGVLKVDTKNKAKKWYRNSPNSPNSLSHDNNAYIFYQDSATKRIWIGTSEGLNRYNESSDDFNRYLDGRNGKGHRIKVITELSSGNILIGTNNSDIYISDKNQDNFSSVRVFDTNLEPIDLQTITAIEQIEDEIWIAGYNAGLFRGKLLSTSDGSFQLVGSLFGLEYGINELSLNSIHVDINNKNNLWINTDSGISKFEVDIHKFFNFTETDGVKNGVSWDHCPSMNVEGVIYYCGPGGIIYFTPSEININRTPPSVVLTDFYINSRVVNTNSALGNPLFDFTKKIFSPITLEKKQSNFAFDFAALDYTDPYKNKYAYMLEGFDDDWIYTDAKRRHANYSNIPAGDYVFKVKASNNHGFWTEEGAQVKITILPVWWLTWWMKLIYLAIFIYTSYWVIRFRTRQLKMRSVVLEKAVLERTYELEQKTYDLQQQTQLLKSAQQTIIAQEKMSSLGTLTAGVAHEINNPTNFTHAAVYMMKEEIEKIKSFLIQLAGGDSAEPKVLQSFEDNFKKLIELTNTATEGTKRIKTIVNDLRTYSRLDDAVKKEVHINTLLASTIHLVTTQYNDMRIDVEISGDPIISCYPAKLSQVFLNVTVNACQAIEEQEQQGANRQGHIIIKVQETDNNFQFDFIDNGCGMNNKVQEKIFDPFFTTKDVGKGTGLGMAISFGIVEEHNGSLTVKSEANKGTTISIILPVDDRSMEGSNEE